MRLLLGLDIGTTAMKTALYDEKGNLLALSTQEYTLITPEINVVEEKEEVYWEAFCSGLSELKQQVTMSRDDEIAMGISAQGETLFFLDENGKSLRNAIVWLDNRAPARGPTSAWDMRMGYPGIIHVPWRLNLQEAGIIPNALERCMFILNAISAVSTMWCFMTAIWSLTGI